MSANEQTIVAAHHGHVSRETDSEPSKEVRGRYHHCRWSKNLVSRADRRQPLIHKVIHSNIHRSIHRVIHGPLGKIRAGNYPVNLPWMHP
jgi:hypothetical protein